MEVASFGFNMWRCWGCGNCGFRSEVDKLRRRQGFRPTSNCRKSKATGLRRRGYRTMQRSSWDLFHSAIFSPIAFTSSDNLRLVSLQPASQVSLLPFVSLSNFCKAPHLLAKLFCQHFSLNPRFPPENYSIRQALTCCDHVP